MNIYDTSDPALRTIGQVLKRQAELIPESLCLLEGEKRLTFSQVNSLVNRYAHGLTALGVQKGDRVSLLMGNCIEFPLLAYAINKIGGVWVPTNTSYRGTWLQDALAGADSRVLIVDADLVSRLSDMPLSFSHVVVRGPSPTSSPLGSSALGLEHLPSDNEAEPGVAVRHTDLASIMWTSGTTGRSKGVMHTHSSWLSPVKYFSQARDAKEGDVHFCCLPLFNAGGWIHNVLEALVEGLPIAIGEFSVTRFWDDVRRYGVTQTVTLGAMHMYLWQAPERPDDADNPLRVFGLIPTPDIVDDFKKRFGIEHTWLGYGQSETTGITLVRPGRVWSTKSSGTPRDDLQVGLLDADDNEVARGEVGEICVRPLKPDVIFAGFFGQPEATVKAFRNLWYHTGDLGRMEGDELFFVDRKADFMRYKGRNISSFEAEFAAQSHAEVHEVAAHGVPSAELAEEDEVKLCVVRVEGSSLTAEELARHINENAPYYLVPRYIEFFDDLPHTPTGRVQKFVLRQRGVTPETWDRDNSGFVVSR